MEGRRTLTAAVVLAMRMESGWSGGWKVFSSDAPKLRHRRGSGRKSGRLSNWHSVDQEKEKSPHGRGGLLVLEVDLPVLIISKGHPEVVFPIHRSHKGIPIGHLLNNDLINGIHSIDESVLGLFAFGCDECGSHN